jgi:RNA recognition motif-containing protein
MFIFVKNLNQRTLITDLRKLFAAYGNVESTDLIRDQRNGRPRGMAMIEMPVVQQALLAIEGLHHTIVDGKSIQVLQHAEPDA